MRVSLGRIRAMVPALAAPSVGSSPGGSEPLGIILETSASLGGRGASPGTPNCRDPLPVPQGSCLLWLGVGRSLPCPCFVPADCFNFCFPSSPSLPCPLPFLILIAALSSSLHHFPFSSSPSLPCHHPCLAPFPVPSPISSHPDQCLSLALLVPIPASFPIFPLPSPS